MLTKLNLLEVSYRSLEQFGFKAASDILKDFSRYLVDFGQEDISSSTKLGLDLKRKGLDVSYADALGYFIALKMGIKFLTGDKVFHGLKGVQYLI